MEPKNYWCCFIWVFPKIGGKPPKWMVYNGKPGIKNGWFGKTHYFRKHPFSNVFPFPSHRPFSGCRFAFQGAVGYSQRRRSPPSKCRARSHREALRPVETRDILETEKITKVGHVKKLCNCKHSIFSKIYVNTYKHYQMYTIPQVLKNSHWTYKVGPYQL